MSCRSVPSRPTHLHSSKALAPSASAIGYDFCMNATLTEWLLDSDPAIRWQVERDLLELPSVVWTRTRSKLPEEGFAARLLSLQDPDGQWAGGAFFPKGFDFESMKDIGQPWTATTWSLNSLREWGVDASVLGDTANRLERNSRWEYDGLPYWGGEVDCCINASTLANGIWLGREMHQLVKWFLDHQMEEGGWNCEWVEGSSRSSFHSTLNSLRGLLYYEVHVGNDPEVVDARKAAENFLLKRNLMNRLTTGELVTPLVTTFGSPNRWRYNLLRGLDYFREASLHHGTLPDYRLQGAVNVVQKSLTPDSKVLQAHHEAGAEWFPIDVPVGQPSKWLTLSALRILNWWESGKVTT